MKKIYFLLISLFLQQAIFAAQEFGKKFDTSSLTPISKLIAQTESYKDKDVVIKGMITNVCSYRGCWMEFASDKKYQTLRLKVRDGDMVFPVNAKGKTAYAIGKISSRTFSKKQLITMAEKRAKATKKKADLTKITGPKTFYQFSPTGVRIE